MTPLTPPSRQYRYVLIGVARTSDNDTSLTAQTTDLEDPADETVKFIVRHIANIRPWGIFSVNVLAYSLAILSSDGSVDHRVLSPEEIRHYIDMAKSQGR